MKVKKRDLFLFGAAAGLALGYFANSDRGRETRSKIAEDISDQADHFKSKSNEVLEKASETVDQMKTKSNSLLSDASNLMEELRHKGNSYLKNMGETTIKDSEIEDYINGELDQFKSKLVKKLESTAQHIKQNGAN